MPQEFQSIFEPSDGLVLSAIRRNKLIIAVCAVAMALAGVGYGFLRQPTYEATASLQVGQVNPNSPGFLGYVQSASSLATAFSRSIDAAPVLRTIDEKMGLSPSKAVGQLSAEPIPLSPIFQVIASGQSQSDAIRLANVAANAVIAFEGHSNSANPQANALLGSYHSAAIAVQSAKSEIHHLATAGASSARLLQAEAGLIAAQVKLKATGNAYTSAVVSQAPRKGLVTLLAGATTASNNRKSKAELYGFIGLLLGLGIGCCVAVIRERRQGARAIASPTPQASSPMI